jgi:hypothetical protein
MIIKEGRVGTWGPDKQATALLKELQALVGRRGRYKTFRSRSFLNVVEAVEITSDGPKFVIREIGRFGRTRRKSPKHFEFEVTKEEKKAPKPIKEVKTKPVKDVVKHVEPPPEPEPPPQFDIEE